MLKVARKLAKRAVMGVASVAGRHSRPSSRPLLWVLMYHRVIPHAQAFAEGEEPGMYVTPETFARHLEWIRECMPVVRLKDWCAQAAAGGSLAPKACAITFDDGWRDNLVHALPALQAQRMPATIFVVSGLAGANRPFWPNRVARLLTEQPHTVATAPGLAWLRELARRVDGGLEAALGNADARAALIGLCKQYPDELLLVRLEDAEREAGLGPPASRDMLDWDEIRQMMASGLIDIGSHTCSHLRLRHDIPPERIRQEVIDSRAQIALETGSAVDLFCYPNGDYTPATAALVASAYRGAVTTQSGINDASSPLCELRRIGMHEHMSSSRSAFRARLSGWV
ncbi:MAG: polysaccharide deacetylase family protein [Gammaproteobacteria bacterium]